VVGTHSKSRSHCSLAFTRSLPEPSHTPKASDIFPQAQARQQSKPRHTHISYLSGHIYIFVIFYLITAFFSLSACGSFSCFRHWAHTAGSYNRALHPPTTLFSSLNHHTHTLDRPILVTSSSSPPLHSIHLALAPGPLPTALPISNSPLSVGLTGTIILSNCMSRPNNHAARLFVLIRLTQSFF
jgi:hypothetical protein